MSRFKRCAAAAFVVALLFPGLCRAADAESLLHDLRKIYDTTQDLSARFVQVSHLAAANMDREVTGRVVFKKGGRMRWDYEGNDPQEIVSDGTTLWIYQVRDKTVMRQELKKLPAANRLGLDLLSGFQGVTDAFKVSTCGDNCLELEPKEARADLSRIRLELDPKTHDVRSVTTEDALGNRTRVEFKDLRRNTGVKDDVFAFRVPKGVEVMAMPGEGG